MIRNAEAKDMPAVADIYNHYILNTTVTFETDAVTAEEMQSRMEQLRAYNRPYFVCEEEGEVVGFCFAHPWSEKAAYRYTLEITVYLKPECTGRGYGKQLLQHLIDDARRGDTHALVACGTTGNEASHALFKSLNFKWMGGYDEVGYKFNRWLRVDYYEHILQ